MSDIVPLPGALAHPGERIGRYAMAWLGSQAPRTRAAYRAALSDFGGYTHGLSVDQIDKLTVAQWRQDMIDRGAAPRTVNQRLSAVRSFFGWMTDPAIHGGSAPLTVNPAVGVRGVRAHRVRAGRVPTMEEVQSLVRAFPEMEPRERLLVAFLVYTPLRRAEILSVRLGDLEDRSGVTWARVVAKRSKDRSIQLPPTLARQIRAVHGEPPWSGETEVVGVAYGSAARVLRAAAVVAGVLPAGLHFHGFRHFWTRAHVQLGVPATTVQEALGHDDLRTTKIYLGDVVGFSDPVEDRFERLLGGAQT